MQRKIIHPYFYMWINALGYQDGSARKGSACVYLVTLAQSLGPSNVRIDPIKLSFDLHTYSVAYMCHLRTLDHTRLPLVTSESCQVLLLTCSSCPLVSSVVSIVHHLWMTCYLDYLAAICPVGRHVSWRQLFGLSPLGRQCLDWPLHTVHVYLVGGV